MDNSTAPEKEVTQTLFKTVKHQIYTINQTKVALSWYDDKRYMIDIINQRAIGHYQNNNNTLINN